MIKAVLFDFYNTLAETTNFGPSWEEVVTELG
jgi:FMN phosphatase YigB (HAD superfamily)